MLQAQGWQKYLHCTEKPHFARQSGSKSFYGGLRKLSCRRKLIELDPHFRQRRKILIISLQSQPTLVGGTHNTETKVVVAEVRAAVVPIRHGTARSIAAPRATATDAARTRRRAGVGGGAAYAAIPVPAPFPYISAHVVYAQRVCVLSLYFVGFTAAVT